MPACLPFYCAEVVVFCGSFPLAAAPSLGVGVVPALAACPAAMQCLKVAILEGTVGTGRLDLGVYRVGARTLIPRLQIEQCLWAVEPLDGRVLTFVVMGVSVAHLLPMGFARYYERWARAGWILLHTPSAGCSPGAVLRVVTFAWPFIRQWLRRCSTISSPPSLDFPSDFLLCNRKNLDHPCGLWHQSLTARRRCNRGYSKVEDSEKGGKTHMHVHP